MTIDLISIEIAFEDKPLIVGGRAMEYYDLRKSGDDIDMIVSRRDFEKLAKKYSTSLKDLYGDLGVVVGEFELWKTIYGYDYTALSQDAITIDSVLIVSIEKLLLMKASAIQIEKYFQDTQLITKYIQTKTGTTVEKLQEENKKLLANISPINYLEKQG